MNTGIDFSALESLNLPEINIKAEDETAFFTDEDKQEIKEFAIKEVESLESFLGEDQYEGNKSEEESKKSTEEVPESTETKTEPETSDVSVVRGLADWAKSEGLFDFKEEEFEDSTDFLNKKINEVADTRAEEKLKEFPDVIYELAKNYKEGVPLDELLYSKSREIEYKNISEDQLKEDKELQKKLVSTWLKESDYTDQEITKKLEKYEDALILEDEALTALRKLEAFEKKYQEGLKEEAKVKEEASKKEYQKRIEDIKKDILGTEEIIPGIKDTPEEKNKIFEAYTKADSKGKTTLIKAIESDPKAWYKITKFMVSMNGNLESVKTKLKTEVSKETKKVVQTYSDTPGIGKLNLSKIKKALEISKNQRFTK